MINRKNKIVFYDYQLTKDIDKFGLDAHPKLGFENQRNVIKYIEDNFDKSDLSNSTLEIMIYKVEVIKTIRVGIDKNNSIIIKKSHNQNLNKLLTA